MESNVRAHPVGAAVRALLLAGLVVLLSPAAARAQMGEDLAPDLDGVEAPLPTQTPLPSIDTDPVERTVNDAVDGLDAGEPDPSGDDDDEGEEETTDEDDDESGGGGGRDGDGDGGSGGADGGGPADGGAGPASDGAATGEAESSSVAPPESTETSSVQVERGDLPYGTSLGRGAVIAARRAARLAGPLAPPLALAAIALGALVAFGRAPERLLKVEQGSSRRGRIRL